jgi:hypothetical protein
MRGNVWKGLSAGAPVKNGCEGKVPDRKRHAAENSTAKRFARTAKTTAANTTPVAGRTLKKETRIWVSFNCFVLSN